jgi:DNA-binding transcriptional ArsR family regulator
VASALARSARATQKSLSEELGLSQRLVSYHLARLEAALLVRGQGRRPRRFAAGPRASPARDE